MIIDNEIQQGFRVPGKTLSSSFYKDETKILLMFPNDHVSLDEYRVNPLREFF
jgi:hypothetical protein